MRRRHFGRTWSNLRLRLPVAVTALATLATAAVAVRAAGSAVGMAAVWVAVMAQETLARVAAVAMGLEMAAVR